MAGYSGGDGVHCPEAISSLRLWRSPSGLSLPGLLRELDRSEDERGETASGPHVGVELAP